MYTVIAEVPESVLTPRIMVSCLILALEVMSEPGFCPKNSPSTVNLHPEMAMTVERASQALVPVCSL